MTFLLLASLLLSQDEPAAQLSTLEALKTEATSAATIVESKLARNFLEGASKLPAPDAHAWYYRRNEDEIEYRSEAQFSAMSTDERKRWVRRDLNDQTYYLTKYGTPLAYSRTLDVAAMKGMTALEGKKVVDFGYGTVGHLRMLAEMGSHAIGVDVDPFLDAIYGNPSDQGEIGKGRVELKRGYFPTDTRLVGDLGRYDVFTSKNTLKKGYVHPSREAKPGQTIDLGVDDETFVRTIFNGLNPGGWVVIYNVCGPKAKLDEPYNPSAEGENPFARKVWEDVGFEVLAYDEKDDEAIRKLGAAFNWGKPEDLEKMIFAWYSVFKKPE